VPITLLVPDPRAQAHHLSGTFLEIQHTLEQLVCRPEVSSWIEAFGSELPDNVRLFWTSLIDYEVVREKPLVTRAQALQFMSSPTTNLPPRTQPTSIANDNPVEFQSCSGFKTIAREFKPQKRIIKRPCSCPDDYKPCFGVECRSLKALRAFVLTGAELPSSYELNRFLLLPTCPIFNYREA
jgi:hypothetical protein